MTRKRRQHGEQVTGEIIQDGGLAAVVQRGDAEQQIARVGNAGVAEQPLEVSLRQRTEVAIENGDAGNNDQQVGPWAVTAGTAVNSKRSSRTKPAALEPMARKAVVGVGAP